MRRYTCLYPKGTYQYKQFYYRGGNNYDEKEYWQKKTIDAINSFQTAKKDLNHSQNTYDNTNTELNETNEYLSMLSTYLGGESGHAATAVTLSGRVQQLMDELDAVDKELEETKAEASPGLYLTLNSEKAQLSSQFSILTERSKHSLMKEKENMQNISKILTSTKYSYAIDVFAEYLVADKCQQFLSVLNNQKFNDVNALQPENLKSEVLKQTTALTKDNEQYSDAHNNKASSEINLKLAKIHEQTVYGTLLKQLEDFKKYCNVGTNMELTKEYIIKEEDFDPEEIDYSQFFTEEEEKAENDDEDPSKYVSKRTTFRKFVPTPSNIKSKSKNSQNSQESKNKASSKSKSSKKTKTKDINASSQEESSEENENAPPPSAGDDLWGEEFPFKLNYGEDGKVIHKRRYSPLSLRRFVTKQMNPLFNRISHKNVEISDDEYDEVIEEAKKELNESLTLETGQNTENIPENAENDPNTSDSQQKSNEENPETAENQNEKNNKRPESLDIHTEPASNSQNTAGSQNEANEDQPEVVIVVEQNHEKDEKPHITVIE